MPPTVANLFTPEPVPPGSEQCHTLLENDSVKIERVLSHAAASPPGFWYDQEQDEWVTLLRGSATLEFEHHQQDIQPGDHLLIPAHLRHRVARTTPDALWLAVHLKG